MQVSIQCGERLERTVRPLLARRTSCECPPSRRISRRSRAVTPSDTGLLRTMSGRRPVRERPRNRLGSRRRRNARLRNSVVLNQRWREPCSSMIRSQPTSHPFRPGGPAVDGRVYRDRGCSGTSQTDSNPHTRSKTSAQRCAVPGSTRPGTAKGDVRPPQRDATTELARRTRTLVPCDFPFSARTLDSHSTSVRVLRANSVVASR